MAIPVFIAMKWPTGIVASVVIALVATVFAVMHDHKYAPQEWKDRQALKWGRTLPLVLILLICLVVYAVALKYF